MSFILHEREGILWGLWIFWVGFWIASALWTAGVRRRPVVRRSPPVSRLAEIAIAIPIVLIAEAPWTWLQTPLLPRAFAIPGLILTATGMGFSFWARIALNQNWSGVAVIRSGHELVREGPYRFVRHPIYGSMLLALAGSVLTLGAPIQGLVIGGLILAVFWIKIRSEQKLLEATFGESYHRFRREIPALIPRLRVRRPGRNA